MQVLILENHSAPVVSFNVFFKTGSVDEPKGKTGLAHLFEHMAFKGTKTINSISYGKEKKFLKEIEKTADSMIKLESSEKSEDIKTLEELRKKLNELQSKADEYTAKDEYEKIYKYLGAHRLNAETSNDYTNYTVSLPSNRLEAWMIIESDRFRNPVLREFYKERSVVLEEKRMYENYPSEILNETLFSQAFSAHPYRNPIIGWLSDLKRLTRTDAEKFFADFYTPSNAVVAIVGDIDGSKTIGLMEKYFNKIKSKPAPDRFYTADPPQKGERRAYVPFDAQPEMAIAYHRPAVTHPDAPAITLLSGILSTGRTSRFYKNIVEGRQLAVSIYSYEATPGERYPPLFAIYAQPKAPHTLDELEQAVYGELDRLKSEPPQKSELDKVVNQIESQLVQQLESAEYTASALAYNQSIFGDWQYNWKLLEKLRQVKPEDISKAVEKYFTKENRTVVRIETKK